MLKFKTFSAEYLKSLSLMVLREIAREIGVEKTTSKKKEQLVEQVIAIQKGELKPVAPNKKGAPPKSKIDLSEFIVTGDVKREIDATKTQYEKRDLRDDQNKKITFSSVSFAQKIVGILEQHPNGYGFLRANNFENTKEDVYVSNQTIKRFNLRRGDCVEGLSKIIREGETPALCEVYKINDCTPESALSRCDFDDLTPYYPDERIKLENQLNGNDLAVRCIDLFAPIGFGQRGLIVAPPKTGKTTLLKKIATSIDQNVKDAKLLILLIDERPEEVTDIKRSVNAEVIFSTFDESAEHHVRVAELVANRAKRLVELGQNVIILLDSITRLARAYNTVVESSGKTLSGGLDPAALIGPKRFFGSARNIDNGGSLTILATALIDTGSRMDDVIYEEFKGTGNMEIHLSRELSEKRIFPAIDLFKSGTRKEEMLIDSNSLSAVYKLRKVLAEKIDATDSLLEMMKKTSSNAELISKLDAWVKIYEKDR